MRVRPFRPVVSAWRLGLNLLWWTLTAHKAPARLRSYRSRRRGGLGPLAALLDMSEGHRGGRRPLRRGPGRRWLAFDPRPGPPRPAAEAGTWRLARNPPGYAYVPPRRSDGLEAELAAMNRAPLFSILVPVYDTPPDLLARLLASVQAQWYPRWELILADDKSPGEAVRAAMRAIDDPRVVRLYLETNGGIAAATNAALARATGSHVVFLDHDDELTADCLMELARAIERDDPDFLYSDEDKIDPVGRFTQPFFKPDWSPDAMMSIMYTCHVSCVRRSLAQEIGGLRSAFDGAQDYDFVLRLTERTDRIAHVPKVLYHWRIIPSSVAGGMEAKPYAVDAVRRAKVEALERRGLAGAVEPVPRMPGQFRVNYFPRGAPLVSIVIPTRDHGALVARCLDSIEARSSYPHREVVILDNGSREPETLQILAGLSEAGRARVIADPAPFNYSALNNQGARAARGAVLLFLNDDTEALTPDWLERMLGYAGLPHVGAVGAKLLFPGGRSVQHCGIVNLADGPGHAFYGRNADTPDYFGRNVLEYDWLAVTGACLMIERAKFDAVGGFDERLPIAYNDVDLCFRLRERDLHNVVVQAAELVHHESASRGPDDLSPEKRARLAAERRRLYERHPRLLARDPFHSPNLHPNSVDFVDPATV